MAMPLDQFINCWTIRNDVVDTVFVCENIENWLSEFNL